jgi:hypothetical protein
MRVRFGRRGGGGVGLLVLFLCVAFYWLQAQPTLFARDGGRLTAQVVDDATGAPLAARVAITDANGRFLEIEGKHEHVQQLKKRWCYVDGAFSVSLPPSGATVEIRRGLETRPLVEAVSGGTREAPIAKTFRLRRWTDMRGKGYVSGDLHAHLPALAVAAAEMRAEDLNVLNLLVPGGNDGSFKGRVDDSSTPGCQIYLSQEVIDAQLGHLTLSGITSLTPGYPGPGGTLEYAFSNPNRDILPAARATRAQNGLVSVAHFENVPGAATPVGVALGLLDAIELPTWSDPMQLPAHLAPWDNSGMSTAEFTPMRGVDLYYQYLNAGFRLPIAAGTDKTGEEIPVGSNRTYVPTKGEAGYAAWLAGIKSGAGFVTNGPLIEFEVDGHGPGDVIELQGTTTIKARAIARSILPFTTIEIVMNGRPVAHRLTLVKNDFGLPERNPPVDGIYTLEVQATVRLEQSSWLAARAFSNPDVTQRLLPRESSVFSHTSPVYFLRDGRKVREEASIVYLRKYVKGLLHWLSTKPAFASEQDRAAVQRDTEQALRFYEEL